MFARKHAQRIDMPEEGFGHFFLVIKELINVNYPPFDSVCRVAEVHFLMQCPGIAQIKEKTMAHLHHYTVTLIRQDPKAGQTANFRVEVSAPDQTAAKRSAEAQFPGYHASGAARVPGT